MSDRPSGAPGGKLGAPLEILDRGLGLVSAGVAVVGAAFVPFLLPLPRPTARRFLLAGAIYVTGAVGLEILGNDMVRERLRHTLQYCLSTTVEEGMEMIGVILFIHTLLHYMRGSRNGVVRASVELSQP